MQSSDFQLPSLGLADSSLGFFWGLAFFFFGGSGPASKEKAGLVVAYDRRREHCTGFQGFGIRV